MKSDDEDDGLIGSNSAGMIQSVIERVEKLEDEKRGILEDIKEIYSEAKSNGLDSSTIKRIVALRRKDRQKRIEEQELLELYMSSIGMEV